ncbi:DUF1786 family protein [Desulfobacterales bacterium HSG17]|nr:DUF1786 family protein [Desulfobacterales bacterium HSG17]
MIDIGAGTMDILYYDEEKDLLYKSVVKSPVKYIAEKAAQLNGSLAVSGCEMGGGSISSVLKQRAKKARVVMSASAAETIHHNPDRVLETGIEIAEDPEVQQLQNSPEFTPLILGDIDIERIKTIVSGFGVPFSFDIVGICVQDHGKAPNNVSHLDFRHNLFQAALDKNPFPHALIYKIDEVPKIMNRLCAIGRSAQALPVKEIYLMDSGMAAILGASTDVLCRNKKNIMVLDIATSHTVGAAMIEGELAGFFEYHTHDMTLERLESLLKNLADGNLSHENILSEGGHGAYIRKAFGFDSAEIILATGPKRKLLNNSNLPIVFGSPLGDNMMTGTAGLLEAVRRRKGLESIGNV